MSDDEVIEETTAWIQDHLDNGAPVTVCGTDAEFYAFAFAKRGYTFHPDDDLFGYTIYPRGN